MDENMGDAANDSSGREPLDQVTSHLDNVKVKEEVRVKKEFKLNDIEGQRRSAFMTYKVSLSCNINGSSGQWACGLSWSNLERRQPFQLPRTPGVPRSDPPGNPRSNPLIVIVPAAGGHHPDEPAAG